MPTICSVPSCSQKTGGHRFPSDQNLRKKWLIAIRRLDFMPTKHNVVCKKHFNKEDYTLPRDSVLENPRPVLKKDAVPSHFAWNKGLHKLPDRNRIQAQQNLNWLGKQKNRMNIEVENEKPIMQCMEVEIEFEQNTKKEVAVQCNLCECANIKQENRPNNSIS